MNEIAKDLKTQDKKILMEMVKEYNNEENLKQSLKQIKLKSE